MIDSLIPHMVHICDAVDMVVLSISFWTKDLLKLVDREAMMNQALELMIIIAEQ